MFLTYQEAIFIVFERIKGNVLQLTITISLYDHGYNFEQIVNINYTHIMKYIKHFN